MDTSHKAALELERLQTIERARVVDRAIYASLSPEDRREFAKYVNKPRTDEIVLGPAAWQIQRRLEATPPEWQTDAEVYQTATTTSANSFVAGKLKQIRERIEGNKEELDSISSDFSQRARIETLERNIEASTADLERLSVMPQAEAYLELTASLDAEGEAAQRRVDDQFLGEQSK